MDFDNGGGVVKSFEHVLALFLLRLFLKLFASDANEKRETLALREYKNHRSAAVVGAPGANKCFWSVRYGP